MLARLVWESFRRRRARVAIVVTAVALAAALATSLLAISLDITDRMAKELRAFGANVQVSPKGQTVSVSVGGARTAARAAGAYLSEDDLPKIKTIFWRNNILGFAPFLSGIVTVGGTPTVLVGTWFSKRISLPTVSRTIALPGGQTRVVAPEAKAFSTGVRTTSPWWNVRGAWADDDGSGALIGSTLAARQGLRPGDDVSVTSGGRTTSVRVTGVVTTGAAEDEQIIVGLGLAQGVLGLPGKIDRISVSALVKPDDALAKRAKRDPRALSESDFVKWYCSPYIDSVTYQIEEVVGGASARPIRQVAEAEGGFLRRIGLTLALVTLIAVVTAALAVSATMTTSVSERVREIGLMKAVGAANAQIALQFVAEAAACGLVGGLIGYASGIWLARTIGLSVFHSAISPSAPVLPTAVILGLGVALLGSAPPIRRAMRVDPVITLRGE